MSSVDLEKLLEESGAVLRGHFRLTSGRHSNVYFEKFRVLEQPHVLSALCKQIADHFRDRVDIVAGPTTGGIIIAFEVARLMGVSAIYVESEDGRKKVRRNGFIPAGSRVLIVDDVLTTGLSIRETIEAVQEFEVEIAGIGVLIDRSQPGLSFDQPLYASYRVTADSWEPDDIPDWLANIPITQPGTRKQDQ